MKWVIFLILVYSLNLFAKYENCGNVGDLKNRVDHCKILNQNFSIPGLELVSVEGDKVFFRDIETGLVWSDALPKKSEKCRGPYHRAKNHHYKKANPYFKKDPSVIHCIADLENYILIPKNRFLIFND